MTWIKGILLIAVAVICGSFNSSNAQDKLLDKKYAFDTIIYFQEGVKSYDFVWSKRQGFYWDTISYEMDIQNVTFSILNDTRDTFYIQSVGKGDGTFLFHRKSFNREFGKYNPLYGAVLPNQKLIVEVELYNLHTKSNFSRPLFIAYSKNYMPDKKLSISVWGCYVEGYKNTDQRLKNKTEVQKGIPYMAFEGMKKNNIPYEGIMHYYNSKNELIFSKKVEKGIVIEAYLYEGEWVNQKNNQGEKTGLWIHAATAQLYPEFKQINNAENLYETIIHKERYLNGVKVGLQHTYKKEGWLAQTIDWNNGEKPPVWYYFNEGGDTIRIDSFDVHSDHRFVRVKSLYFNDSLPDCLIKKETYVDQKLVYTYAYRDCKVYSKTSIQTISVMEVYEEETVFYETFVDEGRVEEQEMSYTERVPYFKERKIPYTVEMGEFDVNEENLINGTISYYNERHELIETKMVRNGLIQEN